MALRLLRHGRREPEVSTRLLDCVRSISTSLRTGDDLDPLVNRIGDARYVLLGEASHGTHEFYSWRAAISRRLIEEKQFSFIAVEGDWPDCHRVNHYIKSRTETDESPRDVLHSFQRWPTWMWANSDVVELVDYLHRTNQTRNAERQVGFYGLDVYSLWDSLYQVMSYVGKNDPASIAAAQDVFRCFEPYGIRGQLFSPTESRTVSVNLCVLCGLSKWNHRGHREDD